MKRNSDLQGTIQEQLMIHQHLMSENKNLQINTKKGQQVTGYQIDSVVQQKMNNLHTLTQQLKDTVRERDQLKKLNEKLVQKVDELQAMIESEANANDYYFNYPPKQDDELNNKQDTEQMKMKRIFDEQLLAANRTFERKFADMAESFSEEVERYNGMFAESQKDLLYWKDMFVDLDTKFKEYVTKSERYIKEKDAQLAELR